MTSLFKIRKNSLKIVLSHH